MNQLSWVAKYRPKTLDHVAGHREIIRTLKYYLTSKQMPNILFSGQPGSGKTAMIHAFATDLYGETKNKGNFKEWNSSDARGIDVVRGPIKEAAQYGPKGPFPWKILYLGEIDGMTEAAQDALKRTMETAYRTVRFMADCNNLGKLIPAIQSRFCHFTVKRPGKPWVTSKLDFIVHREGKELEDEVLDYIYESQQGDLRNCIQILEGLPWDGEEIDVATVRGLFPNPSQNDIALLQKHLIEEEGNWFEKTEPILQRLIEDDPSCSKIVSMLFDQYEISQGKDKWKFLSLIGDYETRITQGNPIHQLKCLLYALRDLEFKND